MKTTMNLPDSLLESARRRATEEGRTVTSLMEEALRELLSRPPGIDRIEPLPVWKGGGHMLIDIDDKDALWAMFDADGTT